MAECQWLTPVLLGSSRSWSGPPTAALPIRWPSLERDGAILVQLEFIEPLVTGGKGVGPQQSMGSMNHANARRSSAARVGEERADTFGSFRASRHHDHSDTPARFAAEYHLVAAVGGGRTLSAPEGLTPWRALPCVLPRAVEQL